MNTLAGVAAASLASVLIFRGCSIAPVDYGAKAAGVLELPLSGKYEVAIHSYLIGSFRGRIAAQPKKDGSGFVANSRPNIAWGMIGGIESALGPIVLPSLFPGGVIIVWDSLLPGLSESGQPVPGEGEFGAGKEFSVKSTLIAPDRPIDLSYRDRRIGVLTLRKLGDDEAQTTDRADYRAVADRIDAALRANLYDPALADSPQVNSFLAKVHAAADRARDDVEFGFGANVASRGTLRFSQTGVLRQLEPEASGILRGPSTVSGPGWEQSLIRCIFDPPAADTLGEDPPRMATIQANWFLSPSDVDRVMRLATQTQEIDGLCIDLRSTFGGNLSALRVLAWLIQEPVEVGVVFSAAARDRVLRGEFSDLPRIDPGNLGWDDGMGVAFEGARDDLRQLVEPAGGFVIRVQPVDTPYAGPVCVLTSARTSGPGEALAEAMQSIKRATVIGRKTGGRMLVPVRIDIGQGWILQVPAYDYATITGQRLEGKGVQPDRAISSGSAPGEGVRLIRAKRDMARSNAGGTP
jgi:Peptidase family S41